uniref:Craniofacial development protein 1 n=1 Tax=Apteryx owenii TaxID=8824 RepID=A0A8B9P9J8_APTOW
MRIRSVYRPAFPCRCARCWGADPAAVGTGLLLFLLPVHGLKSAFRRRRSSGRWPESYCASEPSAVANWKRKKGGLLLEPGEKEEEKAQQNNEEEEVDNLKQAERDREEEEKKKEDALWASFLSDVGQKPKVLTATQVTQTSKAEEKSVNKLQEKSKEPEKPKDAGKLTITEVFDFAGEEVRVTKEVDATSKEAKSFLKQQEKIQSGAPASLPTVSGVKRPSGMSSLLGKITSKKQKMSTLEKSKLDWENFKEEEGIGEELAIHNRGKDGKIRSFWIRDLILYFT